MKQESRHAPDHFSGCLLGGAVGDALGAPVEFLKLAEIRDKYGPAGIADYDVAYGRRGAITDDTQMTLFTAEGALRALARWHHKGICHPPSVIHHAYLRWLRTQGQQSQSPLWRNEPDGWLIGVRALHSLRAPGGTCLSALRGEHMGTVERRLNDSKGCGGVMRVAPVGLVARDEQTAFDLGCESAAITHGHPSGFYPAGCLAAIVFNMRTGASLSEAIGRTLKLLAASPHGGQAECAEAIHRAVDLSADRGTPQSPEAVESLGGGWVGEEALSIALYCALSSERDFARGVLLAVNHSGDSDSTGAIAGNLLGLALGRAAIPAGWLRDLELREEIETVARDLHTQFDESDAWWKRYPGW